MLITVREGAAILGLNVNVTYQKIRAGQIPAGIAVRIGNVVRIHEQKLKAWIDAGGSLSETRNDEARDVRVVQARA